MKMKELGNAEDCFSKCLSINPHCALSKVDGDYRSGWSGRHSQELWQVVISS
jgi:hypothetical protein